MNWDYPYSTSYIKEENNTQLRLDVERTQNDVAKLTSVVEDLRELAQKERNNISELHSRVDTDRADIEALERRCGSDKDRLNLTIESLYGSNGTIDRLNKRLETFDRLLATADEEREKHSSNISEMCSKVDMDRADTIELEKQSLKYGDRLNNLESSMYGSNGTIDRIYKRVEDIETRSILMRKELDDMQTVVHEIDEIGSQDSQLSHEDCKTLVEMYHLWKYEPMISKNYDWKMLRLVDRLMRDINWERINQDAAEG